MIDMDFCEEDLLHDLGTEMEPMSDYDDYDIYDDGKIEEYIQKLTEEHHEKESVTRQPYCPPPRQPYYPPPQPAFNPYYTYAQKYYGRWSNLRSKLNKPVNYDSLRTNRYYLNRPNHCTTKPQ